LALLLLRYEIKNLGDSGLRWREQKFANQCCQNLHNEMNEMKSSSLGELNLEDFIYWRHTKDELKHSFNLFLHCFGLFRQNYREGEEVLKVLHKLLHDQCHVNIFCQFVNLLMAVFKCSLLHWPLFYAWLVLQQIPFASLCLGHTVMCSWYSTGTKIPTGKSRISFV